MEEKQTPLKQIRLYCLQCVCGSSHEVKLCHIKDCPLWNFRFGTNPYRTKRQYTDEQKEAMKERLAKARANRKEN